MGGSFLNETSAVRTIEGKPSQNFAEEAYAVGNFIFE
jgi:hypothetical protein